eukprot:1808916-Pyramimonas_sp.AAC.1
MIANHARLTWSGPRSRNTLRNWNSASAWAWNSGIRVALERPSLTALLAATPMVPSAATSLVMLASTA